MTPQHPHICFPRVPDLPDVQLVLGRGVEARFPAHAHGSYCVGVVDAGQRVLRLPDMSCVIPAHGLFVIAPGQRHACEATGPHCYRVLSLPPERVHALASELTGTTSAHPRFASPVLDDAPLARQFRRLLGVLTRPASTLEREEALLAFLVALLRHADIAPPEILPPERHASAINRVAAHIRAHHADPLRLADLAALAGLSPCHFQRVFQRHTGLSPHEYQQGERIRHARALLDGPLPLPEVAQAAGFCDQSHLNRAFRRLMGISPGVYAAERRG
jgi:AraC-like DNA-binding protein